MRIISPNMLKTFKTCPQKYYYRYVLNLAVPQRSSMFEKGKKIHALANYYLRGDDISRLVTELNEDERVIWGMLLKNEYFQKEYVKSEYNLSCKVGDYWIGGRIDAIVKDENNLYILDYKTGSIPKDAENDYQTMVYLLTLISFVKCANIGISIHFVYIDLKNNNNFVIDFDENKKKEYECQIIEICKNIENFSSCNCIVKTKICETCEYKKFCMK